MKSFNKPPLTVPEQLQLLKDRGLSINSDERATRFLEVVSLFRLSPYMHPFQQEGHSIHEFQPNSSLQQIVSHYRFDSDLRNLVMIAIERMEVATRACISNHMAPKYGSHWYLERDKFKRNYHHARLIRELEDKLEKERETFHRESGRIQQSQASNTVKAQRIEQRKRDNYPRFYVVTYGTPALPPSWAMLEELTLGSLSVLYSGIARDIDRKKIVERFNLPQEVFGSWLHTLTFVRNCCAHHSRLWNRELAIPPKLPQQDNWKMPNVRSNTPQPNRRLFVVLLMLAYLMQHISPDSHWKKRLMELLDKYPDLSVASMGFVETWQQHPIWQGIED